MYGETEPKLSLRNNKSVDATTVKQQESTLTAAEKAQKEELERLRKAYYDDEDGFEGRISKTLNLNQNLNPRSGRRLSNLPKERQEAIAKKVAEVYAKIKVTGSKERSAAQQDGRKGKGGKGDKKGRGRDRADGKNSNKFDPPARNEVDADKPATKSNTQVMIESTSKKNGRSKKKKYNPDNYYGIA